MGGLSEVSATHSNNLEGLSELNAEVGTIITMPPRAKLTKSQRKVVFAQKAAEAKAAEVRKREEARKRAKAACGRAPHVSWSAGLGGDEASERAVASEGKKREQTDADRLELRMETRSTSSTRRDILCFFLCALAQICSSFRMQASIVNAG